MVVADFKGIAEQYNLVCEGIDKLVVPGSEPPPPTPVVSTEPISDEVTPEAEEAELVVQMFDEMSELAHQCAGMYPNIASVQHSRHLLDAFRPILHRLAAIAERLHHR